MKHTADSDKEDRTYRELMSIIRAELPFTFLFLQIDTIVAHRRIRGQRSPFRANPVWYMENLWIEDEAEKSGG